MHDDGKTTLVVSMDDSVFITMRSESPFKTTEVTLKLNKEFDETAADGRKTRRIVTFVGIALLRKVSCRDKKYHRK